MRQFYIICLLILLTSNIAVADISKKQTIAVTPFSALKGEHQDWLSKAISDFIIKDLSQISNYMVVDRNRMQDYSDEMEISSAFSYDKEDALRVGQVAKVNNVIYGNYSITGSNIEINAFLFNLEKDQIEIIVSRKGKIDSLQKFTREMVLEIAKGKSTSLSLNEISKLKFTYTDSIAATERFYRGIDLYDRGLYAEAFGEFIAAYNKDKAYYEALLWVGRMQELQGFYEQSIITYEKLYKLAPNLTISLDGLLFAGLISQDQLKDRVKAKSIFQKLAELPENIPHKYWSLFHLASIEKSEEKLLQSYLKLQSITDLKDKYLDKGTDILSLTRKQRNSAFFRPSEIYDLYSNATEDMIYLYRDLLSMELDGELPNPPKGVFILDIDNPVIGEKFGKSPALLSKADGEWREEIYAIIIPKGYLASAVHMSLTGKCGYCSSSNSYFMQIHHFPIPSDHFTKWIGTLYGQTRDKETLNKKAPFYGNHKDIFMIKLQKSAGEIYKWQIKVEIVPEEQPAKNPDNIIKPQIGSSKEGLLLSKIKFEKDGYTDSMKTMSEDFYNLKRDLSIVKDKTGTYHLVSVVGGIGETLSNLWHSQSKDLINWSNPIKLPISSLSKDYLPILIGAENETLQLFWISTRRGKGWGLWTSNLDKDNFWSDPLRIKLEDHATKFNIPDSENILEFATMQDSRGNWNISFYSKNDKGTKIIRSSDLKNWKEIAFLETEYKAMDFKESHDGIYRISGIESNKPAIHTSLNGKIWNSALGKYGVPSSYNFNYSIHSNYILDYKGGTILQLSSDNTYGLMFHQLNKDYSQLKKDFVTRANAEPYAAIKDGNYYIIALKKSDEVEIRKYQEFATDDDAEYKKGKIYEEVEYDVDGNRWGRIFASMRYIIPDVTTVGIGPKDTIWWGIETGIMYKKDDDFFFQDVSRGYFYHFTSHIASCKEKQAYVASIFNKKPVIGMVSNGSIYQKISGGKNRKLTLEGATGSITELICGSGENDPLIGTSTGQTFIVSNNKAILVHQDKEESAVTAIVKRKSGNIIIGTKSGKIIEIFKDKKKLLLNLETEINDITIDSNDKLWIAAHNSGLMEETWRGFMRHEIIYRSVSELAPDPKKGVWYMASDTEKSMGIGYFDGKEEQIFNPPRRLIEKPSGIKIDSKGNIWTGTWFDGLFKLTRKENL